MGNEIVFLRGLSVRTPNSDGIRRKNYFTFVENELK